ncbi:MAG TPA: DUF167 domain-containing protein [Verrucomicrobiales bacterium]|nr:DUF167 domain-containing protein [Verrucomicrobiales bacterium]
MTVPAEPAPFCHLEVQVAPGAGCDALAGMHGGVLKVKLRARPVEGRANEALREFLAEKLGRPRRAITLVRGETARRKLLGIDGLDLEGARTRLGLE